ncbi:hypothetical protein ACJJIQ_18820 [Microbulbifer sp. ANSA003]|uniref:hypothetical protein n=1 Tax=Microbulbifer sp. ANSA003 TaxID=3243360 RepID=UPI004041A9A2
MALIFYISKLALGDFLCAPFKLDLEHQTSIGKPCIDISREKLPESLIINGWLGA